jgi:hypothetical protein
VSITIKKIIKSNKNINIFSLKKKLNKLNKTKWWLPLWEATPKILWGWRVVGGGRMPPPGAGGGFRATPKILWGLVVGGLATPKGSHLFVFFYYYFFKKKNKTKTKTNKQIFIFYLFMFLLDFIFFLL